MKTYFQVVAWIGFVTLSGECSLAMLPPPCCGSMWKKVNNNVQCKYEKNMRLDTV